jgi:hypothetical protein
MGYDPHDHARKLYRENLWLRELVTAAAKELERLAARRREPGDPLLQRAQRLRRELHQGPPEASASFYPGS